MTSTRPLTDRDGGSDLAAALTTAIAGRWPHVRDAIRAVGAGASAPPPPS